MRIVVPYTHLWPEVTEALVASGHPDFELRLGGPGEEYWRIVRELWAEGVPDGFQLVEHDVIVSPTAIDELWACPSDWCAFRVEYLGKDHPGLGCVKFSGALIARHPEAVDKAGELWDAEHPPRHWCRLDRSLQEMVLPELGERLCVHGPPLHHMRQAGDPLISTAHGCGPKLCLVIPTDGPVSPAFLAAVTTLTRPLGGLHQAVGGGNVGKAVAEAVAQWHATPNWRRLAVLLPQVVPPKDALLRHVRYDGQIVCSTYDPQDGRPPGPSLGMVSIDRATVSAWPSSVPLFGEAFLDHAYAAGISVGQDQGCVLTPVEEVVPSAGNNGKGRLVPLRRGRYRTRR
jgi:hypothetical protein